MAFGAVILACSVTYFIGKKDGATNQLLAQNKLVIGASDSVTKSVTLVADSARKRSNVLDKKYDVVRAKITVVHDTTFLPGDSAGTVDTVANKTLARLIFSADSSRLAHIGERAKQDILVASLHRDIDLRDIRINLLESRGTSRFSKGLQIGVGYCATQNGNTPCIYAGYGVQVRLP